MSAAAGYLRLAPSRVFAVRLQREVFDASNRAVFEF